ncbi:MAG: excinuclease ABC subunit UvrA [Candidatus Aminicenantes bacterium]|nr:excinuclease ABC subunit UvrA [Candidatus Aminicenantes bacterium]
MSSIEANLHSKEFIHLRGVRVHNLKNINLDIPLYHFVVITGRSGSGKSSLAFDTLYAEGQRRYLESLSAYARQFLERMDKPEADLIEGITPAVAIQQKAATKNPRSTVATVTEIHDYLRVLYARIGLVHCLKCGQPVRRDTLDSIVDDLWPSLKGEEIIIAFTWPLERGLVPLKRDGFFRLVKGQQIIEIDKFNPGRQKQVDVFVDRLRVEPEEKERLVDSLEIALRRGDERIKILSLKGKEKIYSRRLECRTCHLVYEEPYPNLFSFNSPQGACPVCHGFGDLAILDEDKIIPDKSKSLEEGAIEPWSKPGSYELQEELLHEARRKGIPTDIPFKNLKPKWQRFILDGGDGYYGVKGFFEWLQTKKYKVQVRVFLSRYRKYVPCPACHGQRLNPQALQVKIRGKSIGDVCRMTVREAADFFHSLELTFFEKQIAERLVAEIENRLRFLLEVGLDYLTLDRMTFTLSGGEAQRINLAAALSSSLVGTLFILDEPSIGLHPRDNQRLINTLKSLKDVGNTVLVVEHDPEIIKAADYIIDLGPGAGEAGGEVLYAGPLDKFIQHEKTLTARYLRQEFRIEPPLERRRARAYLEIIGACKHNLKNIDVRLPLSCFTCLTGVSGSGKSTLLYDVLYLGWLGEAQGGFKKIKGLEFIDKMIMVDQSPLSTSPRSIPATYMKVMDGIREIFSLTREARLLGLKPGFFSFNTPGGRCEACKGAGQQIVEMQFLSDVVLTCEACQGLRYKPEILEIKYRGKSIAEVLAMTAQEAMDFFQEFPEVTRYLQPLLDVGLGYLKLGQPTTTLSGGELQRLKLAHHLVHEPGKRIVYLFDEPTIGLHAADISVLLRCFQRLVDSGHTVVVIEHNLDVIKCADYVIDLGPEGGDRGGQIVAEGTPEEVAASSHSITGKYLRKVLYNSP